MPGLRGRIPAVNFLQGFDRQRPDDSTARHTLRRVKLINGWSFLMINTKQPEVDSDTVFAYATPLRS